MIGTRKHYIVNNIRSGAVMMNRRQILKLLGTSTGRSVLIFCLVAKSTLIGNQAQIKHER